MVEGLAEDTDDTSYKMIPIDYSSNAIDCYGRVFTSFGKIAIMSGPGLKLLELVGLTRERPKDLPSWCPDLTCAICVRQISSIHNFKAWSLPEGDFTENLSTSHENICAVEIVGAQIDTVDSVYPYPSIGLLHDDYSDHRQVEDWLDRCLRKIQTVDEYSHDELPEAFWRTMTLDVSSDGRYPCTHQDLDLYLTTLRYLKFVSGAHHGPKVIPEEIKAAKGWVHYHLLIWLNRAFITTKGGRIGCASTNVRPGDSICILYSGPTTYVLRRYPGKRSYQFISDGYTHGLMNGEGVEMIKSGKVHTQRFILE